MGKTLAQVPRENEIHPSLMVEWKKEYFRDRENAFRGNGRAYKEQARMAELERLVGQLYAENEFLKKKALTRLEGKIKEEGVKEARGEIHAHKRESRIWKPNISKSSHAIIGRKQMRVL